MFATARNIQRKKNRAALLTSANDMCHTAEQTADVSLIAEALRTAAALDEYADSVTPLTCGGMSRIFSSRSSTSGKKVIIKASCKESMGQYEVHGYTLLAKHSLPIPTIVWQGVFGNALIIVMEDLHCTLSSLLLTLGSGVGGGNNDDLGSWALRLLEPVIDHVLHLIRSLRRAGIVFVDLSPDNIMLSSDTKSLVLIDPQFTLTSRDARSIMAAHWVKGEFDTHHLAVKIKSLCFTTPITSQMTSISKAMCAALVRHDPTGPLVSRWMREEVPYALHRAHKILRARHGDNLLGTG
jgi:hypothetical protein